MFKPETYRQRRAELCASMKSGLLLFPGNGESAMNYAHNVYPFRQDASFLYYFGVSRPDLTGVIDAESGRATLFGDDASVDAVIWSGPQPLTRQLAAEVGVDDTGPANALGASVGAASKRGQAVHFLAQYRGENVLKLGALLGVSASEVEKRASVPLTDAVIKQRSRKTAEEVREMEQALEVTYEMHTHAMRRARPGVVEQEIVGEIEGIARAHGRELAYPVIFSRRGETLHNNNYSNRLEVGDLIVNDSGATSPEHYASDITRTLPVGGRFTSEQRDLYEVVLGAQQVAIGLVKPGVAYLDIHMATSRVLAEGMKSLGFFRGDTDELVRAGAHAVAFPHGTGHMIGLDVHDMEALGEDRVGYGDGFARSSQFGLSYLRLAKKLEVGNVVTIEPGLYIIPALLDLWEAEKRHIGFIDYARFRKSRSLGGIRIEDDVLVTEAGSRVLGKPIPKDAGDVQALAAG